MEFKLYSTQLETAKTLNQYIQKKPKILIDGCEPLFITDFGHRWTNGDVYRMFMYYKKLAGIQKKGGVHCFSRHSSATLMISKGCDLRSIQAILRHRDIHTTLRYTHLCDSLRREKHSKYLTLWTFSLRSLKLRLNGIVLAMSDAIASIIPFFKFNLDSTTGTLQVLHLYYRYTTNNIDIYRHNTTVTTGKVV